MQLYVNARHMSEADISKAFEWVAMHGEHVDTLVLQACKSRALPLDLFNTAAPSLRNLTWLGLFQRHSLVQLAPVLGQLPQLRHLAAAVQQHVDHNGVYRTGMFKDESGQRWEEVPDMQQLCPQLQQLDLTIESTRERIPIDMRLVQLLPAGLQQLTLTSTWDAAVCLVAGHVEHLTALQQLTLDGVVVEPEEASRLMLSLGALQEVRLLSDLGDQQGEVLVRLAPKLKACWYGAAQELEVLPQLTHLTLLMLSWRDATSGMPEGTAEALAALTGLQALDLEGDMEGRPMEEVLQQVSGMEALRSLKLGGSLVDALNGHESFTYASLSGGLELCTQLTSLRVMVKLGNPYRRRQAPRFVHAPVQLTGLRNLALPGDVFEYDDGASLAPLSHLTSLRLRVWPGPVRTALVEGPVSQVHDWRAVWRQVGRTDRDAVQLQLLDALEAAQSSGGACFMTTGMGSLAAAPPTVTTPTHWQVTPAVPGGAGPIRVYTEEDMWQVHGWSQPLVPCPHLPGVWELQGEAQEGGWSRSRAQWYNK
jgi:hypothetical protein